MRIYFRLAKILAKQFRAPNSKGRGGADYHTSIQAVSHCLLEFFILIQLKNK